MIKCKEMETKTEYIKKGSESYQIYLYDVFHRLYSNLNRIKQLQLFTIRNYCVDFMGNQWFLYKPKFSNSLQETNNEIQCRNSWNLSEGVRDDIDFNEEIKNGEKIKDYRNIVGEIWVRLRGFPYAYPLTFTTKSIVNLTLWNYITLGSVYKMDVNDDFGYIFYKYSNSFFIHFFKIDSEFYKSEYLFNSSNNYENVLNSDLLYDEDGKKLDSVRAIEKSILITPLKTFKFSNDETFIDAIWYSGKYYVFYHDSDYIASNSIYLKSVDSSGSPILISQIKPTSSIHLPKYNIGGNNVCAPTEEPNWRISVSSDNINVSYESIRID